MQLPIDPLLPDLIAALKAAGRAVLQAPPGAGKTTRVPLALLEANLSAGRIIMLEPRRLATRAAAERMAETLGESVGQTVGYRMRGESRTSAATRIEVVTEGILTRMIQTDPELAGIGAVIFDEFHERSLQADLGLALVQEVRAALRPDLLLIVMSATLDAAPVAALLEDAPILTAEGRSFPVDHIYLDRPLAPKARLENALADLIARAAAETTGDILVFLPGEAEIRRLESQLARLGDGFAIRPLFGNMPFAAQRAALTPDAARRRVVLATSIAETSLTIPGITVVVDGGRARRARFDPGSGMARLVTERVTRAEAVQRAGRAGRTAPGRAYRLWTRGEDGALLPFPPPEIESADLTGLALELALWGDDRLPFLTPPPEGTLAEARALLQGLGALDGRAMTAHGRQLAALPLHPRLGHMLLRAGPASAPLAALMAERDPMRGAGSDLLPRLAAIQRGDPRADPAVIARIRTEAKRLAALAGPQADLSHAQMAALAYPDRIAQRRAGDQPRYLLSGGKGAVMADDDALASQPLLVITDTDGNPREARIRAALSITESEIRDLLADQITLHRITEWSPREGRVLARQREMLGAIALSDRAWPDAPPDAIARAMLAGVRDLGLNWSDAAQRLRARVQLLPDLPAMDDDTLLAEAEAWLLPHLSGLRTAADWRRFDMLNALRGRLDWGQMQRLDQAAPAQFETPLGRKVPIDYAGDFPSIEIRLQEMFGTTRHPMIGVKPLRITLLSPGGKPVQVTTDLPGFWTNSYADVRKDMRGRYPRHPWPEDPRAADPTLRAKPRGT
ncbi:ATP-dependent helicase HrpB [Ketogulonicigenium vulgare]|uniref:ATP-dependent helicase HrpB n=1 Tax=Ketogulonicigenium vulgare TaxID=92945 RepID=UPI0007060B1F|nr:ATP-dependent helicase HrpB [Ketogulonicigenium vulgare]ALJ81690.1 ATP-dependent helicase [Ketogulonicigenium vulgare]ANW34361.1 ATP-dependent helicase HrpB [Ketogulonicigenium vulgare]AOZ55320.1 ATP-dependent helicase HrpB [Ketogulonicigenium vulgare]